MSAYVAKGLHITHWSSEDLARQVVLDGIVPAISSRTVRRILNEVDLQPHRTRYWRTARLDARFKDRAEKVLWCYANARRLARRGIWVLCTDEMPNEQVLERRPIRPIDETSSQFYVSLDAADRPGVLAAIAGAFGRHRVSIQSMQQKGQGDDARLIFVTHVAREDAMAATIRAVRDLEAVKQVGSVLRVVGGEE